MRVLRVSGGHERSRRLRGGAAEALDAIGLLAPLARLRSRWIALRVPMRAGGVQGGRPLPPARLRVMVDGSGDPERFDRTGRRASAMIASTLAKEGVALESLGSILDFGCGCGRVARHWVGLRGPALHGCDYNRQLVAWSRSNLDFMEVRENGLEPPLPYEDGRFDLVYAVSVFTHLNDSMARLWLDELARVVRPRGRVLLTTHGSAYRRELPPARRAAFDRGEPVVLRPRTAGLNACATFHPRAYMERELAKRFDSVAFYGDGPVQDVYVARAFSQPQSPPRRP